MAREVRRIRLGSVCSFWIKICSRKLLACSLDFSAHCCAHDNVLHLEGSDGTSKFLIYIFPPPGLCNTLNMPRSSLEMCNSTCLDLIYMWSKVYKYFYMSVAGYIPPSDQRYYFFSFGFIWFQFTNSLFLWDFYTMFSLNYINKV